MNAWFMSEGKGLGWEMYRTCNNIIKTVIYCKPNIFTS